MSSIDSPYLLGSLICDSALFVIDCTFNGTYANETLFYLIETSAQHIILAIENETLLLLLLFHDSLITQR